MGVPANPRGSSLNYHEFVYSVLAILVAADHLVPQAHIWIVVIALLLCAIKRENTWQHV